VQFSISIPNRRVKFHIFVEKPAPRERRHSRLAQTARIDETRRLIERETIWHQVRNQQMIL
jgi:hypothetical protein